MENYKRFDPFTYDEDEIIWKNDWENEGENYELKTPRTLPPQSQTNIQNKILPIKTNRTVYKNNYSIFEKYLKQQKERDKIEKKRQQREREKFYFGDENDEENYVTYKSASPLIYEKQPVIDSKEFDSPKPKPKRFPYFRLPQKIKTEPPKTITFKLPPDDDIFLIGGKKTRRKKRKNKKRKTLKKK
jgi:hypothetical protein